MVKQRPGFRAWSFGRTACRGGRSGFTLVELVVVIVLMAVVLGFAAPRFFGRNSFEGPAFAQELASAARYAQKLAVATGCPVNLVVAIDSYTLQQPANADCTGGFTRIAVHPATGLGFSGAPPAGVAITGSIGATAFNSRGVPNAAASFGVAGRTVVVTAGSGYVEVQ